MHLAALGLCDGRGILRLAALLTGGSPLTDGAELRVRLAEPGDARMLYDWQQAPETRKFALDRTPFTFAQHEQWLERKLGSERDFLLIGEAGGEACGFVRLDWFGADRDRQQYLISIAAAPGQYRRGVGRALLDSARRLAPGAHLYAKVVEANQASLALFRKCGYQLREDGYYHSITDVEAGRS
jgi:RimJ/RimL family protein N-acetyltransferase